MLSLASEPTLPPSALPNPNPNPGKEDGECMERIFCPRFRSFTMPFRDPTKDPDQAFLTLTLVAALTVTLTLGFVAWLLSCLDISRTKLSL